MGAPVKRVAVADLLQAAQKGDKEAANRLLPLVYNELRALAQARMAHLAPGQTLQPTALVHETYLRLLGRKELHVESRRQFFFLASRAMRDILVEKARSQIGPKRGGGRRRVPLQDVWAVDPKRARDILAVHEALEDLEEEDALKAQIVDLRFFTGMTMKETAQVLGMSERTLHRHWVFTKAWLKRQLSNAGALA
jgi:RNA polymerase sigma factor (TIGR02999 family)